MDIKAMFQSVGINRLAADNHMHSTINHHVNGLNYLCLMRSSELTVKIYYIPEEKNIHYGHLVNPHNHRYEFDSEVISGRVVHSRFKKVSGARMIEYMYDFKTAQTAPCGACDLIRIDEENHFPGGKYFVDTSEIHSIKTFGPTVIYLTQYADSNDDSRLYIPIESKIVHGNSKIMTIDEYENIAREVLKII